MQAVLYPALRNFFACKNIVVAWILKILYDIKFIQDRLNRMLLMKFCFLHISFEIRQINSSFYIFQVSNILTDTNKQPYSVNTSIYRLYFINMNKE